jgi:hypothetical protein
MIIPFVILDICLELYHRVCFPLYRLPLIKRSNYIAIDRHRLSYLGFFGKIFCAYCGYGNGLLAYASAIAAATEGYFCSIRHENKPGFQHPPHHRKFLSYGDAKAVQKLIKKK